MIMGKFVNTSIHTHIHVGVYRREKRVSGFPGSCARTIIYMQSTRAYIRGRYYGESSNEVRNLAVANARERGFSFWKLNKSPDESGCVCFDSGSPSRRTLAARGRKFGMERIPGMRGMVFRQIRAAFTSVLTLRRIIYTRCMVQYFVALSALHLPPPPLSLSLCVGFFPAFRLADAYSAIQEDTLVMVKDEMLIPMALLSI